MEGECEEGITKQEKKYLRSLRQIFPSSYKQAISEFNFVNGVKKQELTKFINSVYGIPGVQVSRAVALESKRLSHKRQLYKNQAPERRRTKNRKGTSQSHQLTKSRRKVGARAKKKALERIAQLCGSCGGSKPKKDDDPCNINNKKENTKKEKASSKDKKKAEKNKKDPCKGKKESSKKKQKKKKKERRSKKPEKPIGVTCKEKLNEETKPKRKRWIPPDKNSMQEPSKEVPPSSGNNQNSSEKKSVGNEENNGKGNSNPESEQRAARAQLYIS